MSNTREYDVTWRIQVDGADPLSAAKEAAGYARHADEGVFEVAADGSEFIVDLENDSVIPRQVVEQQVAMQLASVQNNHRLSQTVETVTRTVIGESTAAALVAALVQRSQWFEVTPLPDDWWNITVKAENSQWLESFGGGH